MIAVSAAMAAGLAVLSTTAHAVYTNQSSDYRSGALGRAPYQTFYSATSKPAMWNFDVFPTDPQPGSIFLAPRGTDVTAPGAYIYDAYGNMIWDGSAFGEAMSFTPFTYQNQSVIALWQGEFHQAGYGTGHGLLLDETYSVIANISATEEGNAMDFHEFGLTDNGTALFTVYNIAQQDISQYGGPADGWIMSGHFQEVDIGTGQALFTWHSLDHVDPSACYAAPGTTGTAQANPWDYFHINSIEKDAAGNYLVSSRHCWAVYYISGSDGSILWTLGGMNSTFAMGANTTFEWQHHARFHGENNSVISLFDNAASGWVSNATESRGIVLGMDYDAKTATLLEQTLPYNATVSQSQGSMSVQPNGNWLLGWGQVPYVSEYTADGTMLWSAQFGVGDVQNYRAVRGNWTGRPKTSPNIAAAKNDSTQSYDVYVSWNGATEVATWALYGGNATDAEGANIANASTSTGFETAFNVPEADAQGVQYFQARAIGKDGATLGWSNFVTSANGTDAGPPTADEPVSTATFTTARTGATSSVGTANKNSAAELRASSPMAGIVGVGIGVLGLALGLAF